MNDEHDEDVLNQVNALLDISPSSRSSRRALDKAESRLLERDDHSPTMLAKEPAMTQHKRRWSPLVVCVSVAAVAALVITVIGISNLADPGSDQDVAHRDDGESDPAERVDGLERAPSQFSRVDKFSRLEREPEVPVLTEIQSKADSFSATNSFAESNANHTTESKTPFSVPSEAEERSKHSQSVQSDSNIKTQKRSLLSRRTLDQCVADSKVIIVATALKSDPAPPKRRGDAPEYLITYDVEEVLKGSLTEKVITTRTPTNPKEFIGRTWVVMLSPEYVAGSHKFAGTYGIKLKPKVDALLSGKP